MTTEVFADMTAHAAIDGAPADVRLTYTPRDPFAVTMIFYPDGAPDGDPPIIWRFARELIAAGLHRPAGIGDVRLGPHGLASIMLTLSAPTDDGQTESQSLLLPRRPLRRFLLESYDVVPSGREPEFLDLDAELAALLGS